MNKTLEVAAFAAGSAMMATAVFSVLFQLFGFPLSHLGEFTLATITAGFGVWMRYFSNSHGKTQG